jgi:hypothetical protein
MVSDATLHTRWLNTLSYLENCGARKIAACEHPTAVQEEMLKHAAEEFRHAHYLKSQLGRISAEPPVDYSLHRLIGGFASLQLLHRLELEVCRYLVSQRLSRDDVRAYAYVLVTYAIEQRAKELYQIYEDLLRRAKSKITVRSILLEEEGHLSEMCDALHELQDGEAHARNVLKLEAKLCLQWIAQLEHDAELFFNGSPEKHPDQRNNAHNSHDARRSELLRGDKAVVEEKCGQDHQPQSAVKTRTLCT